MLAAGIDSHIILKKNNFYMNTEVQNLFKNKLKNNPLHSV